MTMEQKLQVVFAAISSTNWTIGEFLYYAFKTKDDARPVSELYFGSFKGIVRMIHGSISQ